MRRLVEIDLLSVTLACGLALIAMGVCRIGVADVLPPVNVDGVVELQNDWVFAAANSNAHANDLSPSVEPRIKINLAPSLSVVSELIFGSIDDVAAGHDRYLGDLGLYAETIYLSYEGEGFGGLVGKFNPAFGTAWDLAPVLYGGDFAEDYETTERIGLAGIVDLGRDAVRAHRLSVSTFFTNTPAFCQNRRGTIAAVSARSGAGWAEDVNHGFQRHPEQAL
jgi:hypothetical protein